MIIIKENITDKITAFAENDKQFIDSLFTPVKIPGATNFGGSLALFYKIQDKKSARLYWLNDSRGYFLDKKSGLWGQFSKLGKGLFYQYTLAKIEII